MPNATVEITVTGPESVVIVSDPSGRDGVASAAWTTTAKRKSNPGTATGDYVATVTGLTAAGYSWNGIEVTVGFTIG